MELKIRQASCSNLPSMEGKCFSLLASSDGAGKTWFVRLIFGNAGI